jgi:hypothetical protein
MEPSRRSDLRGPICGEGVLGDIAYDEQDRLDALKQTPESREVLTFSCGHEVEAGRLAEASRTDQNVERRQSEETAPEPVEAEGGTS